VTALRLAVLTLCAAGVAGTSPVKGEGGAIRGRVLFAAPTPMVEHRPAVGDLSGARAQAVDRRQSVVYLDSAPRTAFDELKTQHLRMDQHDEQFVPRVLAITVGTTVAFPNSDTKFHNVFSLSRGNSFDLGRYPPGKTDSVRFDHPGIVRVFCDIHSHMSGYIFVFGHPYFAVTDSDGRYIIPQVPAGAYTLLVWSELGQAEAKKIIVADNAVTEADFQIGRLP
jgi:plastocyanin